MKYKIILVAIIGIMTGISAISAQNDSTATGMDAFDYRLQKRPVRPGLGDTRPKDNTFVSASAGISYLFANGLGNAGDRSSYGTSAQVFFGKWFSPISGMRLGLGIGTNRNYDKRRFAYAGLSMDYMLNLSALASGRDYDRMFEVIGLAGMDYMAVRHVGAHEFGGHIGMQLKFHVSPLVDIYLEPKYSILSDGIDGTDGWRNYDTQGTVSLGLTYNMVPDTHRNGNEAFGDTFLDGTFLTFGYGAMAFINGINNPSDMFKSARSSIMLGMGKWFNSQSALRLQGYGGYTRTRGKAMKMLGARLDYLFNFNSAFGGYDPQRRFELILVAGLDVTARRYDGRRAIKPGLGLGLQGDLQVSRHNSIYIEPRLTMYGKDISPATTTIGDIDVLASLNIGFNFMRASSEDFAKRGQQSFRPFADHMFVSIGAGVQSLLQRGPGGGLGELISPTTNVAIGKWFTSISGLRLAASLGYLQDKAHSRTQDDKMKSYLGTASAEYMFDFTSALYGYDRDRVFSLSGLAGIIVAAKSNGGDKFNIGGTIGLQGLFNLSNNWGIHIEPSVKVFKPTFTRSNGLVSQFDAYASLTAGINYTFGNADGIKTDRTAGERKNFLNYDAGFAAIINGRTLHDLGSGIGFATRLGYGRKFNAASALRVSAAFDKAQDNPGGDDKYIGASIEYMLDMTALAAGHDEQRMFSLSVFAGPMLGVAFDPESAACVPGVTGGLRFGFALTESLEIGIEPRATLHSHAYHIDSSYDRNPTLQIGIDAGLAYRF